MDDEFLQLLECPVCLDNLTPPIHCCKNGHAVCGSCRSGITQCPVCRSPIAGRNVLLEQMLDLVPKPCKHFGCPEKLKAKALPDHEANCGFISCICPFCKKAGILLRQLDPHVTAYHTHREMDIEGGKPATLVLRVNYADFEIFRFLRDSLTNKLLPFHLIVRINFNEQTLVACLVARGQQPHPCFYTIQVSSSQANESQKMSYANYAVEVPLDDPRTWEDVHCYLKTDPRCLNLSLGDNIVITLTVNKDRASSAVAATTTSAAPGGGDRKTDDYVFCTYKQYGCFAEVAEKDAANHERMCGFQCWLCIVKECAKWTGWGDYWNHVQESHSDLMSISMSPASCIVIPSLRGPEERILFVAPDCWYRYHVCLRVDNAWTFNLGIFAWVSDYIKTDVFEVTVESHRYLRKYNVEGIPFPLKNMDTLENGEWWKLPKCLTSDPDDLELYLGCHLTVTVKCKASGRE